MPNPKVLIVSRQTPDVEAMLNDAPPEAEIHFLPVGEKSGDHLSGVEITYGGISDADFPKAESLRWVHQPHAGVEGFMYPAFKASDVTLTNCRGLYGLQISEHAFALLLSLTRSIPTQLEFMKRKHWERVPCIELAGMTMGILGLGGIGRAVASRAKAFEFNVIAVDPEPIEKPDTVETLGKLDWLPEFMARSNVVMVCCPSTPETHKLLSHEQFNLLPDGSYLVNVSRGKVVDEDALIAALRSGKLAGAGLDVTYTEPCPPESPLWTEPNVILTSHSAGASQHIRARAMRLFIDNLHRYVKGESLVNVVDKQKGY
ncbi:MAG: D-2-hydroxyacid dehydrogenase [Candidatus Poribacteria bacterium]|nr:D-2-hydroxyacid dehydrogenase [Candidatus Poribacteria bacterium]